MSQKKKFCLLGISLIYFILNPLYVYSEGKLLITSDGTYNNTVDREADYGIEGSGGPNIVVTNSATLTATQYDGFFLAVLAQLNLIIVAQLRE